MSSFLDVSIKSTVNKYFFTIKNSENNHKLLFLNTLSIILILF